MVGATYSDSRSRKRYVFLTSYPAFLRLVVLYCRKGLIVRFFRYSDKRPSSDNCAARNWRIVSAWSSFQNFVGARQFVRPGEGRAAASAGRGRPRPPGLAHQLASARKISLSL